MGDDDTTVTISTTEYESLLWASKELEALESAGVDNWIGYEFAMADLHSE